MTKTIEELKSRFGINPENMIAYIGPGISQDKYEVGPEVGLLFEEKLRYEKNGKFYPDLKKCNLYQLLDAGLKENNIEVSALCTYTEKDLLHSYRRDGERSGRMFGVIGLREVKE